MLSKCFEQEPGFSLVESVLLANKGEYKFNFTKEVKKGYTSVSYYNENRVQLYSSSVGYGFVKQTCAKPTREVHTENITFYESGAQICECEFYEDPECLIDNYNNYGMAFRMEVPVGAYEIYVKTTSEEEDTIVSVSGMHGSRILAEGFWDAANLVPINNKAIYRGKEWTYKFVNSVGYIEIEIEPKKLNVPVGLAEIVLKPLSSEEPSKDSLPTIFTLGDSTVKSYTFDEAPMCGWGQVFDNLFDLSKVNVINYSMGGRSFKNSYFEGRFNDILMSGKIGDYVLIQFGHNDEQQDEDKRFGRGSTEVVYEDFIRDIYIPAIRVRGMIPILVTPMSRVNGSAKTGHIYENSFNKRKFLQVMKKVAEELGVMLIDLNVESLKYYNEIGVEATTAIYMSIEAGETPGKTNDGSYANGHPSQKIDGTHYKEALAKQFARIIVTEFFKKSKSGNNIAAKVVSYLKEDVKDALSTGSWMKVYPEITRDTYVGKGAYYRNQIEKLIQLGALSKDEEGNFNPYENMSVEEYITALSKLIKLKQSLFNGYKNGGLTREVMGAILYDAYKATFKEKPKFMTDYNGKTIVPGDPGYDPNLDSGAKGIMYYPIVSYEQLQDIEDVSEEFSFKIKAAYELGLIRSEKGISRGKVENGTLFEPKAKVTREKAAKSLYYMWVLVHPVKIENDLSIIE